MEEMPLGLEVQGDTDDEGDPNDFGGIKFDYSDSIGVVRRFPELSEGGASSHTLDDESMRIFQSSRTSKWL